jgi:hypothetical protein
MAVHAIGAEGYNILGSLYVHNALRRNFSPAEDAKHRSFVAELHGSCRTFHALEL